LQQIGISRHHAAETGRIRPHHCAILVFSPSDRTMDLFASGQQMVLPIHLFLIILEPFPNRFSFIRFSFLFSLGALDLPNEKRETRNGFT